MQDQRLYKNPQFRQLHRRQAFVLPAKSCLPLSQLQEQQSSLVQKQQQQQEQEEEHQQQYGLQQDHSTPSMPPADDTVIAIKDQEKYCQQISDSTEQFETTGYVQEQPRDQQEFQQIEFKYTEQTQLQHSEKQQQNDPETQYTQHIRDQCSILQTESGKSFSQQRQDIYKNIHASQSKAVVRVLPTFRQSRSHSVEVAMMEEFSESSIASGDNFLERDISLQKSSSYKSISAKVVIQSQKSEQQVTQQEELYQIQEVQKKNLIQTTAQLERQQHQQRSPSQQFQLPPTQANVNQPQLQQQFQVVMQPQQKQLQSNLSDLEQQAVRQQFLWQLDHQQQHQRPQQQKSKSNQLLPSQQQKDQHLVTQLRVQQQQEQQQQQQNEPSQLQIQQLIGPRLQQTQIPLQQEHRQQYSRQYQQQSSQNTTQNQQPQVYQVCQQMKQKNEQSPQQTAQQRRRQQQRQQKQQKSELLEQRLQLHLQQMQKLKESELQQITPHRQATFSVDKPTLMESVINAVSIQTSKDGNYSKMTTFNSTVADAPNSSRNANFTVMNRQHGVNGGTNCNNNSNGNIFTSKVNTDTIMNTIQSTIVPSEISDTNYNIGNNKPLTATSKMITMTNNAYKNLLINSNNLQTNCNTATSIIGNCKVQRYPVTITTTIMTITTTATATNTTTAINMIGDSPIIDVARNGNSNHQPRDVPIGNNNSSCIDSVCDRPSSTILKNRILGAIKSTPPNSLNSLTTTITTSSFSSNHVVDNGNQSVIGIMNVARPTPTTSLTATSPAAIITTARTVTITTTTTIATKTVANVLSSLSPSLTTSTIESGFGNTRMSNLGGSCKIPGNVQHDPMAIQFRPSNVIGVTPIIGNNSTYTNGSSSGNDGFCVGVSGVHHIEPCNNSSNSSVARLVPGIASIDGGGSTSNCRMSCEREIAINGNNLQTNSKNVSSDEDINKDVFTGSDGRFIVDRGEGNLVMGVHTRENSSLPFLTHQMHSYTNKYVQNPEENEESQGGEEETIPNFNKKIPQGKFYNYSRYDKNKMSTKKPFIFSFF